MAKRNDTSKFVIDDAEFERQLSEARGVGVRVEEPVAVRVRYDKRSGLVISDLSNGCIFGFPPELVEDLRGVDLRDLKDVSTSPKGTGICWEKLDVDLSIAGLMHGVFGSRMWMKELEKKGGSVTSEAKKRSARLNGAKGGRPRKT